MLAGCGVRTLRHHARAAPGDRQARTLRTLSGLVRRRGRLLVLRARSRQTGPSDRLWAWRTKPLRRDAAGVGGRGLCPCRDGRLSHRRDITGSIGRTPRHVRRHRSTTCTHAAGCEPYATTHALPG